MSRPPFTAATLLLLAAATAPSAQQGLPTAGAPQMRRVASTNGHRPMLHAVYDVTEDRIRSVETLGAGGPSSTQRGLPPCFDNSDYYLWDTYVVTDPGQELVNWGRKNCSGAGRLRSVTIAYLSEARSVAEGGPGGTLQVALYNGTRGFNALGTEIFRRTITGLPSDFTPLDPPTVFLTLDFGANPLPLADGNFGWGFLQLDGDTGPMLVNAPNVALGTVDAMDIYSPGPARTDTYVGTFNYGALCGCASTWMQLDEIANNEVAATLVRNGSGVNPELLEGLFPPRIGQVWAARVDVPNPCTGGTLCAGNPDFTILFTSAAQLATPLASPFGEILIDRSLARTAPLFGEGAYFYAIPPDTSLVGTMVFVQAAVLPDALPTITLTNALQLRIGY